MHKANTIAPEIKIPIFRLDMESTIRFTSASKYFKTFAIQKPITPAIPAKIIITNLLFSPPNFIVVGINTASKTAIAEIAKGTVNITSEKTCKPFTIPMHKENIIAKTSAAIPSIIPKQYFSIIYSFRLIGSVKRNADPFSNSSKLIVLNTNSGVIMLR